MRACVIRVVLPVAVGFLAGSHGAVAADDAFFVRANVGQSSINAGPYGTDTGYRVDGGYRWAVGSRSSIGFEVGYTNLGDIPARSPLPGLEFSVKGPIAGATARFDIASNWHADARVGYMRADFDARTPSGLSNDDSLPIEYAGAGLGYDLGRHVSVDVAYDYYRAKENGSGRSLNLVSIGAEYRF